MLFRNDVIDMEREFCGGFWKVAILATSLRTANDFYFQCAVWTGHDQPAGALCKDFLALDFMSSSRRPTCL